MTEVVTVETDFADLEQMSQGLLERVHETHVILTHGGEITEGEWVQFAVNLQDGTPGFAGLGRCVRAVDNGDARDPHQRFDLVLDSLQFDPHGQEVYQYILSARGVDLPEAGYADEGDDAYMEPASVEIADAALEHDEATRVVAQPEDLDLPAAESVEIDSVAALDVSEAELHTAPPPAADAPGEAEVAYDDFDAGEFGAAPEPVAAPEAVPTGERLFVYHDGLPIPAVPPRPDIDPSLRVTRAPRPFEGAATRSPDNDDAGPYEAVGLEDGPSPVVGAHDEVYEDPDDTYGRGVAKLDDESQFR